MLSAYTILVDEREKRPLVFHSHLPVWDPSSLPCSPSMRTLALTTASKTLDTGDYVLQGHEAGTVIERKNSLSELANNLTRPEPRRRFIAELVRLQPFRRRILLLEGTPLSLIEDAAIATRSGRPSQPAPIVRDLLLTVLRDYHVELMVLPASTVSHRRAMGEWVAATLIHDSLTAPR